MKVLSLGVLLGACSLAMIPSGGAARGGMSQERYCLYDADTYNSPTGMTLQELASAGVTVVTHIPATQAWINEAHQWGIKAMPYVSLYKVLDSSQGDPVEDGMHFSEHPFWKEVNVYNPQTHVLEYPEWLLIGPDGQVRRPFDDPNYPPYFQQSCCNHQSLINAYAQGVRNVMSLGADGVFVDNVHPSTTCYGATLGIHTHDWPYLNNAQCYKVALSNVYSAVKSYGVGKYVMLNPGGPAGQYLPYGDSTMWESFMWRNPYDGQPPGPPEQALRWDPYTFDQLKAEAAQYRPQGEQSPSVAPLTYLPSEITMQENAFYAYSWARLAGLDQWTCKGPCGRDIQRRLYRVQTGVAVSDLIETGGGAYRQFENALIATNPSSQTIQITMAVPSSMTGILFDLYNACELPPVVGGQITLTLPAESGRVIVSRGDGLDNLLREIEGQSLASKLHIEEQYAGDPDMTALLPTLEEIQSKAAELRATVHQTSFPIGADRVTLSEMCQEIAALHTPPGSDEFLIERLGNLRNYAGMISYVVPEPGTLMTTITGLIGFLAYGWKRRW